MTAEVAILNPHAVALAADSAVTATYGDGRTKIRQSANKIFSLSQHRPVGVMVYASGAINGIPWETAVKVYRNQLGTREFGTVKEYAEDFLGFLASLNKLFSVANRNDTLKSALANFLWNVVVLPVREKVEAEIESQGKCSEYRIKQLVHDVIVTALAGWTGAEFSDGADATTERKLYRDNTTAINAVVGGVVQSLPMFKKSNRSAGALDWRTRYVHIAT